MLQLKRLNDILCLIVRQVCLVLVVSFMLIVLFQVISRNYIHYSAPWTDEVALLLFVWSTFLGAALALRQRKHYLVDIFTSQWIKTNTSLDAFAGFLVLGCCLVFIVGGTRFTIMGLVRTFTSIPLSQAWLFISMPISGFLMFLFCLETLHEDLQKVKSFFSGHKTSQTEVGGKV